jgi:thioredoxin 1
MAGNVREFTDANFDSEVLKSSQPVLVDFWAPWCGPCRQLTPVIEQLATENSGGVKVGKLNIDDNPNAAQQYGVSSIPTVMVFQNGQVAQRFVGVQPKTRLQQALDSVTS